jgi:hypothetical protein
MHHAIKEPVAQTALLEIAAGIFASVIRSVIARIGKVEK